MAAIKPSIQVANMNTHNWGASILLAAVEAMSLPADQRQRAIDQAAERMVRAMRCEFCRIGVALNDHGNHEMLGMEWECYAAPAKPAFEFEPKKTQPARMHGRGIKRHV